MGVPGPSRRRAREGVPSSERNVRRRCPIPDLVASRRRRREEAAANTLAAHVDAVSGRNVRPRMPLPPIPCSPNAVAGSSSGSVSVPPRNYVVLSELTYS